MTLANFLLFVNRELGDDAITADGLRRRLLTMIKAGDLPASVHTPAPGVDGRHQGGRRVWNLTPAHLPVVVAAIQSKSYRRGPRPDADTLARRDVERIAGDVGWPEVLRRVEGQQLKEIKAMKTKQDIDHNSRTDHGEMIANQIQGEDAYGYSGTITASDLWLILDTLHTHYIETEQEPLMELVQKWYHELEAKFPYIETV